MTIPPAIRYTSFSLSVANSQPPRCVKLMEGRLLSLSQRQPRKPTTELPSTAPKYSFRKTRYAIPYGAVIADLGTPITGQPYKFGGKELITANGLNEYDFGTRQYYSAAPAFTRIDPMAEKYPWLSPYLYCANNPVNLVDPSGMDIWSLDEN